MTIPIYIVGYPKSGNTWLSRLMGEVLNCPVDRYDNALPLAMEGQGRKSVYSVRQLHLSPVFGASGETTANELFVDSWNGNPGMVIFIMRDPRDIAVATKFYWEIPSISETLRRMKYPDQPFGKVGAWDDYIKKWEHASKIIEVCWTSYENLIVNGPSEILSIATFLGLPVTEFEDVEIAFHNQSFSIKRAEIEKEPGNARPYGKTIQLKNLRKGIIGDWRNHFSIEDRKIAQEYFGETMLKYEYISHPNWWEEGE